MTTVATVISVSGLVWVQNTSGEQRLLVAGDMIQPDETLVTMPSTQLVVDFGNGKWVRFSGAEVGNDTDELVLAEIPVILLPNPSAGEEQDDSQPDRSSVMPEGHFFVQLVRIAEMIEADGLTPLNVAAIQEQLNPLLMDWSRPEEGPDEERYNRGGDRDYVVTAVDTVAPGVSIELQGAGPDGIYDDQEIGADGTVTAEITLLPGTEIGDLLVVIDKDGNVLLNRPVTQDDLNNGIRVEVPVQPGDPEVTVNATITDPSGNSGSDADTKPIDRSVTIDVPVDQDATESDSNIHDQVVFESGLAAGTNPNPDGVRVESSFSLLALDGLDADNALVLSYTDSTGNPATLVLSKDEVEALATTSQSLTTEYGELVLNGYSQDAGGIITIDYVYTLERAPSVDAVEVTDSIEIQANDRDGDTDSATLGIKIVDDAPVAIDDSNSVTEDTVLEATGNVINGGSAGDVPDQVGADGATITAISSNNAPANSATETGGILVIEGEFGTLTIEPDGSYSYVLDNTNSEVNALKDGDSLSEVFTYTLTDGDEDADTATLTITINGNTDGTPGIVPVDENGSDDPADITTLGAVTVYERGLVDGSNSQVAAGVIEINSPDGLDSLTIGGTAITLAQLHTLEASTPATHITVNTDYGDLTLTEFVVTDSVGGVPTEGELRYSYTLTTPFDNSDPAQAENGFDEIILSVTDAGGVTDNGILRVNIIDDAPVATDDSNSVTEDTVLEATGNVINGGSAGDVPDQVGADGATITAISSNNAPANSATETGGTLVIEGEFGTLTIEPDGSYSYQLDNDNLAVQGLVLGESLDEVFTYTLTDGDGDEDSAELTIVINGSNDEVTLTVPVDTDATSPDGNITDQVVFESGLAAGTNQNPDDVRVESSFSLLALDGLDTDNALVLSYTDGTGNPATLVLSKDEVEALATTSQSLTTEYGELVLNGYSQDAGGIITIDYVYTLERAPSVDAVEVTDSIEIQANDRDGDTDSATLGIKIVDDTPVAIDDSNSVTENTALTATGNVITGDSAGDVPDQMGADGAIITAISSNNSPANTVTETDGTLVIEGEYGTLTIEPDGSYSYQLNDDNADVNALKDGDTLLEVFTYTLTDGDDDSDTATLTITIYGTADGAPAIVPVDENGTDGAGSIITLGDITVFERGLVDSSDTEVAEGAITLTSPDGLASVSLGGTFISLTELEALDPAEPVTHITIFTPYGELTVTGFVPSSSVGGVPTVGELRYSYTLTKPFDNSDPAQTENGFDDIALSITDAGGDRATGTLRVNIIDDTPQANDDSANVTEGRTLEVEGVNGVLANDKAGADGWNPGGAVIGVAAGAVAGEVSGNVATAITGTYGTLTLNADGSYTYVANPDSTDSDVGDVFTYTVEDSDGDRSTTTLTINVADVTEPTANTDGSVSEAGLPTGTEASTDSELISNASLDLQDGWSVVTDQSGLAAFGNWSVATDGTFNYTLTERADHSGSAPTDSFTYEAQDAFGNTVINTVTIAITDDVPSIAVEAGQLGSVTVDESALGEEVTDTEFIADVFDINYGADGEQSTSYRLEVTSGTAAGVTDVSSGMGIFLFMDGDDVVGRVGNSDSGDIAFRISIDASSGAVTLTQSRPLQHPDMDDPNDELHLTDAAVRLIANAVDEDNDSVDSDAVNIGGRFIFLDDGPVITPPPAGAIVDEANLALGSDPDVPATTVTRSLNVDFGTDGAGDVQFTASGDANTIAGLQTQGWQSRGENLDYVLSADGHTLTAYRGDPEDNNTVFVVEITNPTTNPGYAFTLTGALDHLDDSETPASLDLLFAHIRVTDRDGDAVETGFTITVLDDDPSTEPKAIEVLEDSTEDNGENTFNTNADATGDNTSIGDGSDSTVAPNHGMATVNPNGTITYVPNPNFSGTDTFTYTTTTDNEAKTFTVVVTVTPVADAPEFEVVSNSVATNEDESIALGLKTPKVTDDTREDGANTDFPERLGEITLSGIPDGAKLLDGQNGDAVLWTSGGGSVTVVLTDGPTFINGVTGELNLSVAQFEALKVLPPEHDAANFTVTSRVESYEVDAAGNPLTSIDSAETVVSVAVEVVAVTDPVTLSIDGVEEGTFSTTIDEDTSFDLAAVLSASFADLDGSEQRELVIEGLPQGSVVNGITIGASGSITIPAPGLRESTTDFPTISIRPPQDFSGDITDIKVTLRAVDTDGDTDLGAFAGNPGIEASTVTLNLFVNPVAGDVAVDDVATPEDTAIAFLAGLRVTDGGTDAGAEVITQVSFTVPTGWKVTAPTADAGWSTSGDGESGTYTITFDGTLTALERETVLDGFTIQPPAHSSLDASLTLSVTSQDTQEVDGSPVTSVVTKDLPLTITVTPVAEVVGSDTDNDVQPDLTITPNHSYSTAGAEDEWFKLGTEESTSFNLSNNWQNQDSSEEVYAVLTPTLTAGDGSRPDAVGSMFRYSTDGGSTWVEQTYNGGDAIEVPLEYLNTLEFKAAQNFSGMFEIKVQAKTVDFDDDGSGGQDTAISGEAILTNVLIKPVADVVTTAVTARVQALEDTETPLSIRPSSSDPSETFNVTIDAIPDGAVLKYDGIELAADATGLPTYIAVTSNGNGSWKVTIEGFDPSLGGNMSITPPPNANEPFTLNVGTVSVDTLKVPGDSESPYESISGSFDLSIRVTPRGVADEADIELLDLTAQSFTEEQLDTDGGVMLSALVTKAELTDTDGSETLTFRIKDLPTGFAVEGATPLGTGQWTFARADLETVKITTPANFSGTEHFTLVAVTTENDGDSLSKEFSVGLRVTPSPEAMMNLSTSTDEDVSQQLDFGIQHRNGDTDEEITAVWIKAEDLTGQEFTLIYGVNGDELANGQDGVVLEDGWFKLTGNAIDNIYVIGDANWSGSGSFAVRYEVTDPGNDDTVDPVSELSDEVSYSVTINPVTDQPVLKVTANSSITLNEPNSASINLQIANQGIEGGDYDGSEQLIRIVLDNVPRGVIVNDATFIGGNQWLFVTTDTFNAGALDKTITLQVRPEAAELDNHQLGITVTTEDAGNGQLLTDSVNVSLSTSFQLDENSELPAEIVTWEQSDFMPTEDVAFSLAQGFNAEIENDVTDNGINITLSGLPEGTQVTGMTLTIIGGEPVWTASAMGGNTALQTLLDSISVTPPADWNSNKGPFEFDAKLTTFVPSGLRAEEEVEADFAVTPVSDPAEISIAAPAVDEGNDLIFTINVSNSADDPDWTLVDGKLYVQLDDSTIAGSGVLKDVDGNELNLSAVSGVDGVADGNYYVLEGVVPGAPVNVIYTPPGDHVNGNVSLTVRAQSTETGSALVQTSSATEQGVLLPVNNGYDFSVADVSGSENPEQQATADKSNVIRLNINDGGLVDSDGSESVQTVLLSNVPNGFLVYVGTTAEDAVVANLSNNAGSDGSTNTWLLGAEIPQYVGIMPPQYWSGELSDLRLQVISSEDALTESRIDEKTFSLTVEADANGVSLDPTPSFGREGQIIRFNLNAELRDPGDAGFADQSTETLTLAFTGMGENAAFYLGDTLISVTEQVVDHGGGSYTISGLSAEQADTLGFVQSANALNNVQVCAQTVESANGDTSDWTDRVSINTSGVTSQFATTGDDTLLWTGESLDGFAGEDTIVLRFAETLSGEDLSGSLSNIEVIDMTGRGADRITSLSIEDVLNMTDSRNTLRISGDAEDSVQLELDGGWSTGETTDGYITYTGMHNGNPVTLELQNTLIE